MNVLGVEGGKEQKRMQKALAGPGQGVSGLSFSSFLPVELNPLGPGSHV